MSLRNTSIRGESEQQAQFELDSLLRHLCERTRLLPRLTAYNGAEERQRLVACIRRGERATPAWHTPRHHVDPQAWQYLDVARWLTRYSPAGELYEERLDELELELAMIGDLGSPRSIRPLAARRFGTGQTSVPAYGTHGEEGTVTLTEAARSVLESIRDTPEPRTVPASAEEGLSLASMIRGLSAAAGLEVEVRIEPRLAAAAAAGERTVLIADRAFGPREALRLAVHEVLGHLVAAGNGRAQPLRLLEVGTAGSFADQEGLAITLEERAGLLDGRRLRVLAARVVAADRMHEGASFDDTCRELVREHGFSPEEAVPIAERAHRGGGVARDVSYMAGWLRVRAAVGGGGVGLDELRAGRIGLEAVPTLRRLRAEGYVRSPVYRPNLESSLGATFSGTSFETSPPREVTSLTRFEAT